MEVNEFDPLTTIMLDGIEISKFTSIKNLSWTGTLSEDPQERNVFRSQVISSDVYDFI